MIATVALCVSIWALVLTVGFVASTIAGTGWPLLAAAVVMFGFTIWAADPL